MYQRVAIEAVIYKAYQAAVKKLAKGVNFKFNAVLRVHGDETGDFTVRSKTFSKSDFLHWFNQMIDKIRAHFESYKTLEHTTFDCDFFFTILPAGAGGTENRALDSIYKKTSVVRIKNDDNACFWHSLAVLMNKEHEDYRNIRRGGTIRTELAKELCERCSMNWNEPVSVDSFEIIEGI